MNSEFLAGATEVVECFARELSILQTQLKAEERRAAAELIEPVKNEAEGGFSLLWVTKTALEVRRQRLAQERMAKKSVQRELAALKIAMRQEQEKVKAREAASAQTAESLQVQLQERDLHIIMIDDVLRIAQDDKARIETELRDANLRFAACEETNLHLHCTRTHLEVAGDQQLARAYTQVAQRNMELRTTRKELRVMKHAAMGARSTTELIRARSKMARRNHKATRQKLRGEQDAHEELKFTCRQLIDLVEGLEAAAEAETVNWHRKLDVANLQPQLEKQQSHVDSTCKYKARYKKTKALNRELRMKLVEVDEAKENENENGVASKKRKASGEIEQQKKRRARFSV
ncbi:hypothetical protein C8R47DRAFT_1141540 [Mycena vitilis]|nr:hypothetical protein C8R47DRAFT_1141540 [Mycena vitilis]